ncbi:MAG: hypothetical protein ABEH88_11905 [Halobacteriales archaeon]
MLDAARVAAAANVVFLLGLIGIWVRNYLEIRSPMTLGSTVFAVLLLAENGLAFYYYTFSEIALSVPAVRAMMYLQILEAVGIAVLTYVTWR